MSDHESGCSCCGSETAAPHSTALAIPSTALAVRSTALAVPSTALAVRSTALAVPAEPPRQRSGVATLPVPGGNEYPAPYPNPWRVVGDADDGVGARPRGPLARATHALGSIARRRR